MSAKLQAWMRSKNISAHTIAALLVTGATLFSADEQVRNLVLGLFQEHPKIAAGIASIAAIILKYSHSSSAAGTVATSQVILASPNAPTPLQVAAANTAAPTANPTTVTTTKTEQ